MNITHKVIIDLAKPLRSNTIEIKANDANSVVIDAIVQNAGNVFDMSSVEAVSIRAITPSGNVVFAAANIVRDEEDNKKNEVTYTLSDTITKNVGRTQMEFEFLGSLNEVLTSFDIFIEVQNILYDEEELVTDDDLSGFREYLSRTLHAAQLTEEIERSFEVGYGTMSSVTHAMEDELASYEDYLAELQAKVARGDFNGTPGPQGLKGPQGERGLQGPQGIQGAQGEKGDTGDSGVVAPMAGFFAFTVDSDGDLYIEYNDGDPEDLFELDADGNLYVVMEE